MSPRHHTNVAGHPTPSRTPHRHGPNLNARSELYSLSPVRFDSQRMLLSPRKAPRAVSKVPYKVLDAPDLADDFYLNLVDWGSSNVLGVGLGSCVYMWNSQTGRVTKLCDLEDDIVTSVSWIQRVSRILTSPWFHFTLLTVITGIACVYRYKQRLRPDLGCRTLPSLTYDDGTQC